MQSFVRERVFTLWKKYGWNKGRYLFSRLLWLCMDGWYFAWDNIIYWLTGCFENRPCSVINRSHRQRRTQNSIRNMEHQHERRWWKRIQIVGDFKRMCWDFRNIIYNFVVFARPLNACVYVLPGAGDLLDDAPSTPPPARRYRPVAGWGVARPALLGIQQHLRTPSREAEFFASY